MEVLLELESFIRLVVPDAPPTNEWVLMGKCVERIRPIANATEDVESDSATLITVLRWVAFFLRGVAKVWFPHRHLGLMTKHWENQTDFTTFNEPALKKLHDRCGKHFKGDAYLLARAFSPESDLSAWTEQERDQLTGALDSLCIPILKKLGYEDQAVPQFKAEFGKWVLRAGPLGIPPDPKPGPIPFWQSVALHTPLLSKVALTILAITPSEACVERSFSHQGLLYSDLRTRLNEESIHASGECAHSFSPPRPVSKNILPPLVCTCPKSSCKLG